MKIRSVSLCLPLLTGTQNSLGPLTGNDVIYKAIRVLYRCVEEHYLLLNHGKMRGIALFIAQCFHVLPVERCRIFRKTCCHLKFFLCHEANQLRRRLADWNWKPRDQSQLVKTDPRRENSHFMDHKLHKLHKQHDTGLIYVLKHMSSFEVCAWHESNMSQTAV